MTISDEDPNAVHAIILTFNEGMHIGRCIRSIFPYVASILVVDSGSTDGTAQIARDAGAEVIQNPWVNYATQLNFGISRSSRRGGGYYALTLTRYSRRRARQFFKRLSLKRTPIVTVFLCAGESTSLGVECVTARLSQAGS